MPLEAMFPMRLQAATVLQQGFHLSQSAVAYVPRCSANFLTCWKNLLPSASHRTKKKSPTPIPSTRIPSPSPSPIHPHLVDAATALHGQNGLHLVAPRLQHIRAGVRNSPHLLELAILHLTMEGFPSKIHGKKWENDGKKWENMGKP